jgi:hypothetical protein
MQLLCFHIDPRIGKPFSSSYHLKMTLCIFAACKAFVNNK